jgi:alkanesulfonate monooxygenase SsuD/methylene tetrahydromethanopterin reductase-like flavin-dependent oxidoreductase (luciferase family)
MRATLRQVARWGDACNVREAAPLSDDSISAQARAAEVRQMLDALERHCETEGRDPAEVLRTHFTVNLMLDATMEAAKSRANQIDTAHSTSPGTRRDGLTSMLIADPARAITYYQAMVDAGIRYFIVQLDMRDAKTIEMLKTEVAPHVGR